MAIVTDPDDLDRFQVAVDPTGERLSIRGLGTSRVAKSTTGETAVSTTFTDSTKNFTTAGVIAGDILAIVNKNDIGHHVVASVGTTTLTVQSAFTTVNTALTYKINADKAIGGAAANVADGVTLQCLYSFLKEEWRTFDTGLFSAGEAPDLINFLFPFESITREQFEIGGSTHSNWDFKNDFTRNLIRTGGWTQINSAGVKQKEYAGIITLGSIDSNAQVYYLQTSGGTPANFVLTGPVNQSILTFTEGGANLRGFLNLFVRKKGRSYAGSSISDIGVTTIEAIVNRFPLAHVADPAIVLEEGALAGDGVAANVAFQSVSIVDSAKTDGVSTDPTTTDDEFTFTSATAAFTTTNTVTVGDTLEITSGPAGDRKVYEIKTVTSGTELRLFIEPGQTLVGGSSLAFTTRTRVRSAQKTNGVTADSATAGQGTFTSATANFSTDGVIAGDILRVKSGTARVEGTYKIVSVTNATTLEVNTLDQDDWPAESSLTFDVVQKGMHLDFKKRAITISATTSLTFNVARTLTRTAGSWITDGVAIGDVITITGSASNNKDFTVLAVTSATVLTMVATDTMVTEGPVSATATCNRGYVRTLNGVKYAFNWRQFGNGGTLAQCFQWLQRQLRRATDIDEGDASSRGDITALLQAFASPNTVTTNLVIDNVAAADANNLTQKDATGVSRNDAFLTAITITLNGNINDAPTKKLNVYWTASPNQFGTTSALLVQDSASANMTASDAALNGASISFTYNYDATQNGHGGVDEPITIVCMGTDKAQYAKTSGTITKKNENAFALVAGLERNYSNP